MNLKTAGVVVIVIVAAVSFTVLYRYDVEVSGNSVSSSGFLVSDSTVTYAMKSTVVGQGEGEMNIGIALDTDKLDFGVITAGATGYTRTINIGNNEDVPVKIVFAVEGDIAPYVQLEDNGFILESGKSRTLSVRMSSDTPGNYTGTLYISARKVNQGWLEGITPWL